MVELPPICLLMSHHHFYSTATKPNWYGTRVIRNFARFLGFYLKSKHSSLSPHGRYKRFYHLPLLGTNQRQNLAKSTHLSDTQTQDSFWYTFPLYYIPIFNLKDLSQDWENCIMKVVLWILQCMLLKNNPAPTIQNSSIFLPLSWSSKIHFKMQKLSTHFFHSAFLQ